MTETLYRKVRITRLTYWWIDPGGSQHGPYQLSNLFGYFPTPEAAREHAVKMNLGEEIARSKSPEPLEGMLRRRLLERKVFIPFDIGYEVEELEAFTADEVTFEIVNEKVSFAGSQINTPIDEGHRSFVYRRLRS